MNRRSKLKFLALAPGLAFFAAAPARAGSPEAADADVDAIRAVLKTHDDAMTNHDLNGVLSVFAPKGVLMGTGPGEVWAGPDQLKIAYEHFFTEFDKGQQDFQYYVKFGELSSEMGWLVVSGEIKGQKEGKPFAFPMNISLTVSKASGNWQIAAMHFSTLTGEAKV